jgi:spore coat polysaccharide biosynthesis protein SpsF
MTAIILQARLDSSRLAEKALLPLNGKPLLFRVMEALNHIRADTRILACPQDSYKYFTPLAQEAGFQIFCGPKDDVLERFCQVIKKYSIKRVIRATGDNPFVFSDAAAEINREAASVNADYAGYTGLPYGAGVESVNADALLRAACEAVLPFEREHVCPYLYNNPDFFNIHRPAPPSMWQFPDIRLTVDTREDYDRAVELYNALKEEPQKHNGITIIKTAKKILSGYEADN